MNQLSESIEETFKNDKNHIIEADSFGASESFKLPKHCSYIILCFKKYTQVIQDKSLMNKMKYLLPFKEGVF